ncbi:MAG: PorV/PorQ family protein [Bacteroidota bacterium]|nr:PorV/PorQ family protein [Bacteroidota bacterium]
MKYYFLTVLLSLSLFSFSQTRIYRNDFLNVGAGARALGLAGSTTAGVNDETASYWNPAGLQAMTSDFNVGAMHAEYFAGLSKYDFAALGYKLNDSSALGFSMIRMGTDNIPNTLELIDANGNVDYDRISYFSSADYAFLLTYARKSKISGLSYGVQAKIIYRHLGEFANAYGFGFDAGVQYKRKNWQAGAMLKDATSTFNAWFFDSSSLEEVFAETGNEIPVDTVEFSVPQLNVGIARKFQLNENFSLLTEIGTDLTFDGQRHTLLSTEQMAVSPHIGFEGGYKNMIFLRVGAGDFSRIPDFDKEVLSFLPAIGVGLKLYDIRIDYAFTDIGNLSGALYSNIFSLSYAFDRRKK